MKVRQLNLQAEFSMQSCIFKAETGENHCSIVSDDNYIKDKLEKLDHK